MSLKDCEFIISGPPREDLDKNLSSPEFIFTALIKQNVDDVAMVEVEKNSEITFGDLIQQCLSAIQGLKMEGVKEGSMVAIASFNSIEANVVALAAIFLGATVAPIDPKLKPDELESIIELLSPDVLYSEGGEDLKKIENILNILSQSTLIIVSGQKHSYKSFESLLLPANLQFKPPLISDLENYVPLIMFTSGSTGLPKGVMLPNYYIMKNLNFKLYKIRLVKLLSTPLFWLSGIFSLLDTAVTGSKLVFLNKLEEETVMFDAIERYKVNISASSPKTLIDLLSSPHKDKYDLRSLLVVYSGGVNLGADMTMKLQSELFNNKIQVLQAYGMTEVGLITLGMNERNKPGSSGKLKQGSSLKIISTDTGKSLGPNQCGEICIKDLYMMKGYYKNPKATAEVFDENGWFHTGDIGHYDEDEFLFVYGRLSDLIKYKNQLIIPSELENILRCHSSVKDVIVTGKPHPVDGEHPIAFVNTLNPVSENDLIHFLAERSIEKKPLKGVRFVNTLPYTCNGKPKRRILKERLMQEG